jgi:hypothetical protein
MRGSTSNQKQIRQAHLPEACQRPGCPSQAASVVPLLSTKATARSAERRRQPSCPPSRDAMTTGDERHRHRVANGGGVGTNGLRNNGCRELIFILPQRFARARTAKSARNISRLRDSSNRAAYVFAVSR